MKHLVIPDCQVKSGVDTEYLRDIGRYIVEKKPDVIICIGDFADMPSLSSYDQGKKSFEGRRYKDDIMAAREGMEKLLGPVWEFNERAKRNKERQYNPRKILTLGNHENRIDRAIDSDPKLDGTIGIGDLGYSQYGFEVYPYLEPVIVDGIAYAHYFTSGAMGRAVPNARQLALKKHMSCTMGHVQNWELHREVRADGTALLALFAGSCYTHNEDYLGPQGNHYDRGIWMKHEVDGGSYHPLYVSLSYLKRKYAEKT
ncbi:MAG: hypothetical protein NUV80_07410 [Candidatus Berkelbacteria bacterium]|nr:hypothetical protein [Candidatus Berkelbacteria bacterium]